MLKRIINKIKNSLVSQRGQVSASQLTGALLALYLLSMGLEYNINDRIKVEKDSHLNSAIAMAAVMNDRIIQVFADDESISLEDMVSNWPISVTKYDAKITKDNSNCSGAITQENKRSIICNGSLATLGTLLEDLSTLGIKSRIDNRGDPSQADTEGERQGDYSTDASAVLAIHKDVDGIRNIHYFVNLVAGDGTMVENTSYAYVSDSVAQQIISANTIDDTISSAEKCYFSYIRMFDASDLGHLATEIDYYGSQYQEIELTAACPEFFGLESNYLTDPNGISVAVSGESIISLSSNQVGVNADTCDLRTIVRVPLETVSSITAEFTP